MRIYLPLHVSVLTLLPAERLSIFQSFQPSIFGVKPFGAVSSGSHAAPSLTIKEVICRLKLQLPLSFLKVSITVRQFFCNTRAVEETPRRAGSDSS